MASTPMTAAARLEPPDSSCLGTSVSTISTSRQSSAIPSRRSSAATSIYAPSVVLASSRCVINGQITPGTIVISPETGKITDVFSRIIPEVEFPDASSYVDHSPHILMPGIVDAHVHLNEPGRTEWEGFHTGTQAAAFGGVTTVIDMPLNAIPPTTTMHGLREKIAAAQGKCWVDVGFYGGIIPGNASELKALVSAGVRGFKGFLIDSGVPEFPAVSSGDIRLAMAHLKDEPTTLMFHAEMIPPITGSVGDDVQTSLPPLSPSGHLHEYATFLASRPPSFETYAIEQIILLAHLAPNLPLHIVHLSALEAIPLLRAARADGVKITAETCFHYLSLAAEKIANGDARHKCCPPIRGQANQDALWEELTRSDDSVIATVVSDHSPCTPELKMLPHAISGSCKSAQTKGSPGDFFKAWGGVSSVGLGMSVLWTEARHRNITVTDVVKWCCENTAKQVGLEAKKGKLAVGMDADVIVFDDTREWIVGKDTMLFKNKCSAYEGKILRGKVRQTWVRGQLVFEGEKGFVSAEPVGRLLLEPRTK